MDYKTSRDYTDSLKLKDIASAMEYGNVTSDRRVQIKMPSFVVNQIDKEFPNIDRSKLLTQLAIQALLSRKKFKNRSELEDLVLEEQKDLDTMWDYLEERESK